MSAPQHKSGVPTRDFTDAGTGERFEKGKPYQFETGAHANHLAAGLLEPSAARTASAPRAPRATPRPKARKKAATKPVTAPAADPAPVSQASEPAA